LDKDIDLGTAIPVVLDAKTDYPSACNAMETLLVHQALVRWRPQDLFYFSIEPALMPGRRW